MTKKNTLIIGLLATAVVLFCVIQFAIIPANRDKQAAYAQDQTDALTHDITSIEAYKSPYVGDATNVSHLFYALPLGNISMKFEIDSDTGALTVNYLETVWDIGEDKVQRDLIYNTVAAMATIDNLTAVTYNFSGDSFTFSRKEMEDAFGSPLSALLEPGKWNKEVQNKLNDGDFVKGFYD